MTWLDDYAIKCHETLLDQESDVMSRLYSRGVSDDQVVSFSIGVVPEVLPEDLDLRFTGWASKAQITSYLVFPLTSPSGRIVGFQFRSQDRKEKRYLDYFCPTLTAEPVSFGFRQATDKILSSQKVWLVEGVFDLLALQRFVPNIIAVLSVRTSVKLIRTLKRLAEEVLVGYDMDVAGRNAAFEFRKTHRNSFKSVHIIEYPKVVIPHTSDHVKDPGDLWEVWGDEKIAAFVNSV